MKAHIIDVDALRAISPMALASYARAEGWQRLESYGDHSEVYHRPQMGEVIIPGTEALSDYHSVVSDLIASFARAEARDELAVYRDLVGADRDVIRVRSPEADGDGSVRIEAGVDLVLHARDLLLSAACAAKEPRASYRAGKVKDATDYMDRVRLGQTEHGSFVVTLLAPVPPALDTYGTQAELWPSETSEPFDRLVTRRLADGLQAARSAAEHVMRTGGGLTPFRDAVSKGVSANLCEALAQLIERGEGLEVSVTWAKTRLTPEPRRKIFFSRSEGEVLREAARVFRTLEPRPDETIEGFVISCDRKTDETSGRVAIRTIIDGQPSSVKVELSPSLYSEAVQAHEKKQLVSLNGDLKRHGQRWHLVNTRDITAIEINGDEDDL
ncbi:hypothetical protein [uncultured Brevundimonas sp.]|uniref:hypothetical protein n=1 Tax=uncultured Brevundimonas sp. TaxID=213418 RepID=UPI002604349B|nr:hypothetical protein [uncultured Brevundimonas sp.]